MSTYPNVVKNAKKLDIGQHFLYNA